MFSNALLLQHKKLSQNVQEKNNHLLHFMMYFYVIFLNFLHKKLDKKLLPRYFGNITIQRKMSLMTQL